MKRLVVFACLEFREINVAGLRMKALDVANGRRLPCGVDQDSYKIHHRGFGEPLASSSEYSNKRPRKYGAEQVCQVRARRNACYVKRLGPVAPYGRKPDRTEWHETRDTCWGQAGKVREICETQRPANVADWADPASSEVADYFPARRERSRQHTYQQG